MFQRGRSRRRKYSPVKSYVPLAAVPPGLIARRAYSPRRIYKPPPRPMLWNSLCIADSITSTGSSQKCASPFLSATRESGGRYWSAAVSTAPSEEHTSNAANNRRIRGWLGIRHPRHHRHQPQRHHLGPDGSMNKLHRDHRPTQQNQIEAKKNIH